MNPISIQARIALWTIMAVAAAGAAYGVYLHVKHIGYEEAVAEYKVQADAANTKRAAVTPPIVAADAKAQETIRYVTKTLIKEIPVYVKTTDCPMPAGFRVLHDAAANGELPDAAAIPDAAPVPAPDVAETVADNYGTCRAAIQNLTSLRSWVDQQAQLK